MIIRLKQVLTAIGLCSILTFLGVCCVLLYLNTDSVGQLIQTKANRMIYGKVTLGKHRFNLFKGELELRNVLIESPSGEALARVDRLFVKLSWESLLTRRVRLDALTLEKPWVKIQSDSKGETSLVQALSPKESTKEDAGETREEPSAGIPLNLSVSGITLTNGSVDYEKAGDDFKARVEGITLHGNADLSDQSGSLSLHVGEIWIEGSEMKAYFTQASTHAVLFQKKIAPLDLEIGTPGSQVKLSGNISNVFDDPNLDLTLELAVSLPEIRKYFQITPGLSGTVTGDLHAKGNINNPEADLHLSYGGGLLWDYPIGGMKLDLTMKDRLAALEGLTAQAASGGISVRGEIDLRKAFEKGFLSSRFDPEAISYSLYLEQNRMKIEELTRNALPLTGQLSSTLSLSGRGLSLQTLSANGELELVATQLSSDQVIRPTTLNVKTKADLHQQKVTLQSLEIKAGDAELTADGVVDFADDMMKANLLLNIPDLQHIFSLFNIEDVAGKCEVNAKVEGSVKQPVATLSLKGDGVKFQKIVLGNVLMNANLGKSGELRVSELSLTNAASTLSLSGRAMIFEKGTLNLLKDPGFEVSLRGNPIQIEDFYKEVKGKATIACELNGSVAHPKGVLILQGEEIDFGVQKIHSLQLESILEGEKYRIRSLQIAIVPGELIEGTGWISTDSAFGFELVSQGVSLGSIDIIRGEELVQGEVLLRAAGEGNLRHPRIKADLLINRFRVKNKDLENAFVHLDLDDEAARLSGVMNVDFSGAYYIGSKDFNLCVLFNETSLEPYFSMAGSSNLNAIITGRVEAKGNIEKLKATEAVADLSRLELFFEKKEVLSAQRLQASLKKEVLFVPGIHLSLPEKGWIDARGSYPLNGVMNVEAKGDIPLGLVNMFVSDMPNISGKLTVAARMGGTWESPDVKGDIRIEEAGFALPEMMQKFSNINGTVHVTQEEITIDGVQGKLDAGKLDLSGAIRLKDFSPVEANLTLNASDLPLKFPETAEVTLNSSLKLQGTPDLSKISGEITVLEGVYYKDMNLRLTQVVGQRTREVEPVSTPFEQPFLKNLSMDIIVKRRNAFMIENNLASLKLSPDLLISGTLNNPVLGGRAQVESGTITYQKKVFEVKKGVIDFLNPYHIEPSFDILGETTVREWTIDLRLSGTPEKLNFELSSTPQENEGDILSLLLIGKTTSELAEGQGGKTKNPQQMLAEMVASTFGEEIKKATGLDVFDVEIKDKVDKTDSNDVKVTIGKNLSKRMAVYYAAESKNGIVVQRATSEYKFLENVLIKGFQDTEGELGSELLFRLEFR